MEKITLKDIKQGQTVVNISVLAVYKFPIRERPTKSGEKVRKTELKVADVCCPKCKGEWEIDVEHNKTKCISCGEEGILGYLDLWRDQVDKYDCGDVITLINGFARLYEGNPNLSSGFTGILKLEAKR